MSRRGIVLHVALAASFVLGSSSCRPPTDERPNVIVLLVDTLRADYLGSYGFPGDVSPNLDRLAEESVVFENCYANAPWTPPSVGTLFTSLYPQVHGLNRFTDHRFRDPESGELRGSVLAGDAVTLAESFREAGYRTVAFVANPWLESPFGLGQGFEVYDDSSVGKGAPSVLLTAAAREWLEERSGEEPFFMYLHFMDIHEPYDSPKEDFDALWSAIAEGDERFVGSMPPDFMEERPRWVEEETRKRVAYWRTRYAAGVRAFDRRIAGFLDHLRESGLMDRSYVVLTSDHGEELHEHFDWGHGKSLHEHQLRVPLIVRPPRPAAAARRIADHVRLIDLMPTLLAAGGVEPPPGLQGVDVSRLLHGEAVGAPLPVVATGVVGDPEIYSLVDGHYKLVVDLERGPPAVYDLEADPAELVNLAQRETELTESMLDLLRRHVAESNAGGALEQETIELPQELQQPLRALGYLD